MGFVSLCLNSLGYRIVGNSGFRELWLSIWINLIWILLFSTHCYVETNLSKRISCMVIKPISLLTLRMILPSSLSVIFVTRETRISEIVILTVWVTWATSVCYTGAVSYTSLLLRARIFACSFSSSVTVLSLKTRILLEPSVLILTFKDLLVPDDWQWYWIY